MHSANLSLIVLAAAAAVGGCIDNSARASASAQQAATIAASGIPIQTVTVVNKFPHDPGAFTQGLYWSNGSLYEGTGLEGKSSLREVNLSTGAVLRRVAVPAQYFGEGIALLGGKIYQLTWTTGKAFVYDAATFKQTATLAYTGEGWGLTTRGDTLVMSDGTARIRFVNPANMATWRTLDVTANGDPVPKLNELEFIRGEIWANLWQSDQIARIDPATGKVIAWVDLTGLLSAADRGDRSPDVVNGIAYDAERDRIFVTGKLWPMLYEIKPR